MQCYEVVHVRADSTGPVPGLTWRSAPGLGSRSDRIATGLKLRGKTGR
jgi:hypothetical protein